MALCGSWSLISLRHGGTEGFTLWCRSWICTDCEPYRRAALCRFAKSGDPKTFMTLTVNPSVGTSPKDRAEKMVTAFRQLMRLARKRWNKSPIEYFAVFEATKQGEPHLHVLMRAPYIPQAWLSERMKELLGSPIVDIRFIDNAGRAAHYVSKYVGKRPGKFGTLKRYWHSKGYSPEQSIPRDKDEISLTQWYVVKRPLWMIADDLKHMGWDVSWAGSDHFTQLPLKTGPPGPWRNHLSEEKVKK